MAPLDRLRSLMLDCSYVGQPLDAYFIPNHDAHQTEYLSPVDLRSLTVSGVSARKAASIVTSTKAVVWTDTRWFALAQTQLFDGWTVVLEGLPDTPSREQFLINELPPKSRVGANPFFMSYESWKRIKTALSVVNHSLVPIKQDLVDVIRNEQGTATKTVEKLYVLDIKYTGMSWQDKVRYVREHLKNKCAYGFVVSKVDELAWLFNLRGADIPYNPVFFGFALVTLDDISIFVDESKVTDAVRTHLGINEAMRVTISPYEDVTTAVSRLAKLKRRIWMAPDVNAAIALLVDEDDMLIEMSPVASQKVFKNPVEIEGMRNCHIRDAVALCEFWSWLEQEVPSGTVCESSAADKLDEFCQQQSDFIDTCFKTGSVLGDGCPPPTNNPKAGKIINDKGLYINASGRHYKDGTTNITRVMHYGTPSPWQQECYTRVLKGHVDLARTVFPTGTTGHALDAIARRALWDIGLDYLIFTGHGVGHVLHVMEEPYGISNQPMSLELPLSDGMFVTIEPAYYEDGSFGIRLENMFIIRPAKLRNNYQQRGYFRFEPISFLPFSRKMIMTSLLTQQEIDWLNEYHTQCIDLVGPVLSKQGKQRALDWLISEAKPIQ